MIIILSHFHSHVNVVLRFGSCSWNVIFKIYNLYFENLLHPIENVFNMALVCSVPLSSISNVIYAQPCETGMATMGFYCDIAILLILVVNMHARMY
jgi:hypothetical protein